MSDIFSEKEGGLEAPTRHPVDWKDPSFMDKEEFLKNPKEFMMFVTPVGGA